MKKEKVLFEVLRENYEVTDGRSGGFVGVTPELPLKDLIIYLIKHYEKINKKANDELYDFLNNYDYNPKTNIFTRKINSTKSQ